MSEHRDFETGVLSFPGGSRPPLSSADPDVLARAVRDHKAGDAFAQAVITLTLMFAIGAVAFVLSIERAAAASLFVSSAGATPWVLGVLGMAGAAVLIAAGFGRRRAPARIPRRPTR